MNDHLRAAPGSPDDATGPRPVPCPPADPLTERIARTLHARAAHHPDPAQVAARIEDRLAAGRPGGPTRLLGGRGARVAAAGVVTSTLAVAGAGAAAATNPYSPMAATVESVVRAVGIDWSVMPEGYTREQYEAFWNAGYEPEDVAALGELWGTDNTETKARAGQLLLEGRQPPVAPGEGPDIAVPDRPRTPPSPVDRPSPVDLGPEDPYWDAGYRYDDAVLLAELWGVDVTEAKARAAQVLRDGQTLPVPPSGPPGTGVG